MFPFEKKIFQFCRNLFLARLSESGLKEISAEYYYLVDEIERPGGLKRAR